MTGEEKKLANLQRRVEALSRDAFDLARESAGASRDEDDRRRRADELDRKLDELIDPIQTIAEQDRAAIVEAWNDGRLDVAYVLAGGKGPMSLRLGGWLESSDRPEGADPAKAE